jgi:hypothetical protein
MTGPRQHIVTASEPGRILAYASNCLRAYALRETDAERWRVYRADRGITPYAVLDAPAPAEVRERLRNAALAWGGSDDPQSEPVNPQTVTTPALPTTDTGG